MKKFLFLLLLLLIGNSVFAGDTTEIRNNIKESGKLSYKEDKVFTILENLANLSESYKDGNAKVAIGITIAERFDLEVNIKKYISEAFELLGENIPMTENARKHFDNIVSGLDGKISDAIAAQVIHSLKNPKGTYGALAINIGFDIVEQTLYEITDANAGDSEALILDTSVKLVLNLAKSTAKTKLALKSLSPSDAVSALKDNYVALRSGAVIIFDILPKNTGYKLRDYSDFAKSLDVTEDRYKQIFNITLNEIKKFNGKLNSQLTPDEKLRLKILLNQLNSVVVSYEQVTEIGLLSFKDKSLRNILENLLINENKTNGDSLLSLLALKYGFTSKKFWTSGYKGTLPLSNNETENLFKDLLDLKMQVKNYNPQMDFSSQMIASTLQSGTSRGGSASSQFENLPQKDYTELQTLTRQETEGVLLVNNPGSSDFNLIVDPATEWGKHLVTNVSNFGSINIPSGEALFTLNNLDQLQTDVTLEYTFPVGVTSVNVEIVVNFISNYNDFVAIGSFQDGQFATFFIDIDPTLDWTKEYPDHDIHATHTLSNVNTLPSPLESSAKQTGFITFKVNNITKLPGEDNLYIQFIVDDDAPASAIIVDRVTITTNP